jgi:hypothetical protein
MVTTDNGVSSEALYGDWDLSLEMEFLTTVATDTYSFRLDFVLKGLFLSA